jgi:hypothetical protein
MKSSDFNKRTTPNNEQTKENYDDLDFLLKGSNGILTRENQADLPSEEFSHAIHIMNEILKNMYPPETRILLDDLLTPQEVMQKLCISERTLSEWRKINKIGFTHIENKFYYKKQDIENLLQGGYVKAKIPPGKR